MEIYDLTAASSAERAANRAKLWMGFFLMSGSLLALRCALFAAVPDGYVVKVESTTVYLDWGKASGVQAGDQFKLYRPGAALKHPVTGEILGQTDVDLGLGVVERLEEKFSTGKILEAKGHAQPGDRTRHTEVPVPTPAAVVPASATATSSAIIPRELWRSESFKAEAVGITLGDVDGDGKKEVVVAFKNHIELFRWNGQALASVAVFKGRGYGNYMAVETADLDRSGRDKIFATLFYIGVKRSRTVVLAYENGAFTEAAHFSGFVRAPERADGKRELLWQDLSLSREIRVRQPAPVVQNGQKYKEGDPLKLARALNEDQLFGFGWGDWDGDGSEDLALLQGGERLRLFFSATKASADAPGSSGAQDAKWSSKEAYGGTQNDFPWENDQIGSLYPRLLNWKPASGKVQLLVPHNIPFTPIRFSRLKIFKTSEIVSLAWNGLEMAPLWTLPVAGMTADFAVGDAMQRDASQLWIAAVGAGNKTVLIAYQVP